MEPLAVAVHAMFSVGKVRAGQTLVTFGCGTVGLLCMAVARVFGASRIIAVDNNSARLDFASRYITCDVFEPAAPLPGESKIAYSKRSSAVLKNLFKDGIGTGSDSVVDATGAETCIQMGLMMTKSGGTFVQVTSLSSRLHREVARDVPLQRLASGPRSHRFLYLIFCRRRSR